MKMLGIVTQLLKVLSVALAPVLLIYSLVAWRGVKGSKMLPALVALGVLLSLRAATCYSREWLGQAMSDFLGSLSLSLAIILLIFSLRAYVHFKLEGGEKEIKWVSKSQRTRS